MRAREKKSGRHLDPERRALTRITSKSSDLARARIAEVETVR